MNIPTTPEERRIIICAIGGFQLDDEERKAIRPFYLRLLDIDHPGFVRPEALDRSERTAELARNWEIIKAGRGSSEGASFARIVFGQAVCATCDDTHVMKLNDASVPCTRCPTPCPVCRQSNGGAFCEYTPCACGCHRRAAQ